MLIARMPFKMIMLQNLHNLTLLMNVKAHFWHIVFSTLCFFTLFSAPSTQKRTNRLLLLYSLYLWCLLCCVYTALSTSRKRTRLTTHVSAPLSLFIMWAWSILGFWILTHLNFQAVLISAIDDKLDFPAMTWQNVYKLYNRCFSGRSREQGRILLTYYSLIQMIFVQV